jgi:uncharacterized protein (DUF58 family)
MYGRRLSFVLFLALALLGLLALAACSSGEPQIDLETTRLELGDVPNGQVVEREVTVRNTGTGELVVEEISTSCGCTSATLEPMQLAPGESGVLHIEFDSGAHGEELTGPLVRQVFLNSNDPAQPEATVELSVNVTARQRGESGA